MVTVGDSAGRPARGTPLRLVRLGAVEDVRGLGGDIEPWQIVYDPPYLTVVDSIGPGEYQVAFTYVVSEGVTAVEMAAAAPLTEFVLEVQRGSVTARPDPRLDGKHRAVRGGSFLTRYYDAKATHRDALPPVTRADDLGFRCVWAPSEPAEPRQRDAAR